MMNRARHCLAALVVLACAAGLARGQATYKLEVKPALRPSATLTLEGTHIRRSALKYDPGFRLQLAFKKNGKALKAIPARGADRVDLPDQTPGTYSAVLELFYPSYKTGDAQKGQFRVASNELIYEVQAPARPGATPRVVLLANRPLTNGGRVLGKPAVVIQCGKGQGAQEKELLAPGYDYELVQGTRYDGWGPPAGKSHGWIHKDEVRCVLKVPVGVTGVLRLHAVDGGGTNFRFRVQKLLVEGREIANQAVFHGAGVIEVVDVSAKDTSDGKIEIVVKSMLPPLTAVLSSVEFYPTAGH